MLFQQFHACVWPVLKPFLPQGNTFSSGLKTNESFIDNPQILFSLEPLDLPNDKNGKVVPSFHDKALWSSPNPEEELPSDWWSSESPAWKHLQSAFGINISDAANGYYLKRSNLQWLLFAVSIPPHSSQGHLASFDQANFQFVFAFHLKYAQTVSASSATLSSAMVHQQCRLLAGIDGSFADGSSVIKGWELKLPLVERPFERSKVADRSYVLTTNHLATLQYGEYAPACTASCLGELFPGGNRLIFFVLLLKPK